MEYYSAMRKNTTGSILVRRVNLEPIIQWHPTPILLPGKSHGWRSLVGLQSMGLLRVRHD